MEIKAIETEYNGYKFRSRLEARWAVFFDEAGIDYQYEPEGFDLGNGVWYLPDFYLPQYDVYVEAKPCDKSRFPELKKCVQLVENYPKVRIVILGSIPYNEVCNLWWSPCMYYDAMEKEACIRPVCITDRCGDLCSNLTASKLHTEEASYLEFMNRTTECQQILWLKGECPGFVNDEVLHAEEDFSYWDTWDVNDQALLHGAYTAARQARFEHGETPKAPKKRATKKKEPKTQPEHEIITIKEPPEKEEPKVVTELERFVSYLKCQIPAKCRGFFSTEEDPVSFDVDGDVLFLTARNDFIRMMIDIPQVVEVAAIAYEAVFEKPVKVRVRLKEG